MNILPDVQNCCPSSKMQKKSKNNFRNIFKIIIENRRIDVRVQNLATESFKFIITSYAFKWFYTPTVYIHNLGDR